MLVQAVDLAEAAVAEVALVGAAVPRHAGGLVRRGRPVPADELLGDEAAGILGPHRLVDPVAVQGRGARAAAALEVVREARSRRVAALAEGARYGLAAVGARVEVLYYE